MPAEPETSYFVEYIIEIFLKAHRDRDYFVGMAVVPKRIRFKDISDIVEVYPSVLNREVLDTCVIALDDLWMSENNGKQQ